MAETLPANRRVTSPSLSARAYMAGVAAAQRVSRLVRRVLRRVTRGFRSCPRHPLSTPHAHVTTRSRCCHERAGHAEHAELFVGHWSIGPLVLRLAGTGAARPKVSPSRSGSDPTAGNSGSGDPTLCAPPEKSGLGPPWKSRRFESVVAFLFSLISPCHLLSTPFAGISTPKGGEATSLDQTSTWFQLRLDYGSRSSGRPMRSPGPCAPRASGKPVGPGGLFTPPSAVRELMKLADGVHSNITHGKQDAQSPASCAMHKPVKSAVRERPADSRRQTDSRRPSAVAGWPRPWRPRSKGCTSRPPRHARCSRK